MNDIVKKTTYPREGTVTKSSVITGRRWLENNLSPRGDGNATPKSEDFIAVLKQPIPARGR